MATKESSDFWAGWRKKSRNMDIIFGIFLSFFFIGTMAFAWFFPEWDHQTARGVLEPATGVVMGGIEPPCSAISNVYEAREISRSATPAQVKTGDTFSFELVVQNCGIAWDSVRVRSGGGLLTCTGGSDLPHVNSGESIKLSLHCYMDPLMKGKFHSGSDSVIGFLELEAEHYLTFAQFDVRAIRVTQASN